MALGVLLAATLLRPRAGYRASLATDVLAPEAPVETEDRVFRYATTSNPNGLVFVNHPAGQTQQLAADADQAGLQSTGELWVAQQQGTGGAVLTITGATDCDLQWVSIETGTRVEVSAPAGGSIDVGFAEVPTGPGANLTVFASGLEVTVPIAGHPDIASVYAEAAMRLHDLGVNAVAVPEGVRMSSPLGMAGGGDQDGSAGRIRVTTRQ